MSLDGRLWLHYLITSFITPVCRYTRDLGVDLKHGVSVGRMTRASIDQRADKRLRADTR